MHRAYPLAISMATLAVCIAGALAFSYALFQPVVFQAPRSLTVREGETARELARELKALGTIRSVLAFRVLYALVYRDASIKAGDYTLTGSSTLIQTAQLFIRGMPRKEKTITVIEGWTVADIGRLLEENGVTTADAFVKASQKDMTREFSFLPRTLAAHSLEGYLFPDTYRIFENSTNEEIIQKMLDNFQEKYTPDMIAETLKRKRSVHEIVVLASILEREVKDDADRRMVADIFYRRLVRGMPLQADSTINYITGKNDAQARSADLQIDSPYNTYRHKGLPPGPIGNPGLSALQAALSPIDNPFWFFLTTKGGDVAYSKTFEEHVKNKLKYLK